MLSPKPKTYPKLKDESLWVWAVYQISVSNAGFTQLFWMVNKSEPHLFVHRDIQKPRSVPMWPLFLYHMSYPAPKQRTSIDFWR